MASPPLLQSNAAKTEQQWTFYLAHYCGHMLQLCCRAFSFQYYRGQTGCDWLPLPEPPDYIQGLEPGIMKSVAPTGTGPAAYSWTLKAAADGSGINSGGYASVLSKAVGRKAIQRWVLWLPLWHRWAVWGLAVRRWRDQSGSDLLDVLIFWLFFHSLHQEESPELCFI